VRAFASSGRYLRSFLAQVAFGHLRVSVAEVLCRSWGADDEFGEPRKVEHAPFPWSERMSSVA